MNVTQILNTIRSNASEIYRERIPEATRDNIEQIRFAMIDGDNVMVANEFVSTLLNKLVKSVIHTKLFSNPLKSLKKGTKPLGDTIEEIYTNFCKGEKFDFGAGGKLLNRVAPDTKTVYHRMNYQQQYTVTVTREVLQKAFASYDALENYITSLIQSLYNSAELDEFINMKQVIKSALESRAIKGLYVSDPLLSEADGKEFIKTVKTVSGLMAFPSTEWNGYTRVQHTDSKPITTFSRKNEQVLIIDTATDTSINVDVLASVFNMSVAEFNDTKKIVVDCFPEYGDDDNSSINKVHAVLVDEAFFQIYDDFYGVTEFYNGQGLYHNYYLNVWQTIAYSPLVNAVAFVTMKQN